MDCAQKISDVETGRVLEFVLFCVEMYAQKHEISGKTVMNGFDRHGVVDFLRNGYDVLHTQGRDYVISEIETFLENRGLAI